MHARGADSGGTIPAKPDLDFELIYCDGEPLDSEWHRLQINLLPDVIRATMAARGRRRFYAGGNMFVYYDPDQARGIASDPGTRKHYKGPDVFYVSGVKPGMRDAWVTWDEGRYPEVIVELVSPSSEHKDRVVNKKLYEQTFRTPEYFLYDPRTEKVEGFRLDAGRYREVPPDSRGRLWSERLQAFLGVWHGSFGGYAATWVRLFDREGRLLLTDAEIAHQQAEQEHQQAEQERQHAEQERQRAEQERQRAEQERQRAEQERQRAEDAEAEVARLRARLAKPADSGSPPA